MAAVKAAIHISDVSHLDQVNDATAASLSLYATRLPTGLDGGHNGRKIIPKFMVVGHRGHGMNILQSTDKRLKAYKENSILSFNHAANYPLDFIEFDVQVTKDDTPIIFHDNFILSEENGNIVEKRVTDLTLDEFFSYGPQRETGQVGKSLLRNYDGTIVGWNVEIDDHSCTLEEAFQKVNPCLGFNIELKFDDYVVYELEYLVHVLQVILKVVHENAQERPVIFSSFQPDAALLMKKLQDKYPVSVLLDNAISGGLDGVVSEANGIFRNPTVVREIKESNLSLLTYGNLNNVPEAVHAQYLMGVEGVIVDLVQEITSAVACLKTGDEGVEVTENTDKIELSSLLNLVSQVMQH
ncbi:putative glycerophosphodiester phosphodiesterase [Helianthus annuus]|nr:putative glycerophosphodiester phosphodiesterase [Helianthus annuus]